MNELRDELMTPAQYAKFAAAAGLAPPGAPDTAGGPVEQQGADGGELCTGGRRRGRPSGTAAVHNFRLDQQSSAYSVFDFA